MIGRIAAGLARNAAPEHQWRRLAVPTSALLFMLMLLASTAALVMADRQQDRDSSRSMEISTSAARTDLFVEADKDIWRGKRISVAWVEPADAHTHPVLPPGMGEFPKPGQSVVSPELDRLADAHPGLDKRYPNRVILGDLGLRSGDELIAYVRPSAGRSIGGEKDAIRGEGGQWVGQGPVARVSGFGRGAPLFMGDPPPWSQLALGAIGMAILPGIVLLAVGLAAASGIRDHRFQVLSALGARRRTVLAIGAVESLLLALPGLALATAVWWLVAPRLQSVPLVGDRLVQGDLALPWWLLILELGAAVMWCGLLSIAVLGLRRNRSAPRPTSQRAGLSGLAMIPLVMSFLAFAVAGLTVGDVRVRLNLLGTVMAVAGAPLVVPAIMRAIGKSLVQSRSVTTALAGRWMEWSPKRVARPFVGLACLIAVVLGGAGYFTVKDRLLDEVPAASSSGVEGVVVRWRQVEPDDLTRFTAAVGTGLVAPYAVDSEEHEQEHEHEHEHAHESAEGPPLKLGATCAQVVHLLGNGSCDSVSPQELDASTQQRLARAISNVTGEPIVEISLVPAGQLVGGGDVLVLDRSPLEPLDERIREAARSTLPAPYVDSQIFERRPVFAPVVGWVRAGMATALIAVSFGCLISLVDRILGARKRQQHLLNLGISPMQLTRFGATIFAIPFGISTLVGFAAGVAICIRRVSNPGIPMPWSTIGATLLAILVVGVLGTGAVAALGTRDAMREAE